MYKSKRQKNKSFDWYGLSQRFSIRKYHFGAASVLLGTALILGSPQATAKADDTVSTPTTQTSSEQGADAGSSSTTDSLKNVTLPTTASTTEATVLEKPELSAEEIAKVTSSETTAATTEKAKEESKPAASDAVVKTIAEEKTKTDKLTEKETKAEEKAEKKEDTASQKTILTQLTSEAEVLNTTAANYAEKKVEDKASKDAIASAVAAAKVEIAASKKVLEAEEVTKAELDAQLQRISSAIEAVYAEMKRGGHIGKVEAVLAGETSTQRVVNKPASLTPIQNPNRLSESEVSAIKKEIRTSNPDLTPEDEINVTTESQTGTAGSVTINFAGGGSASFLSGDVVISSAGVKNLEQLSDSINWFNFAAATITYTDGSVASPVKYYDPSTTYTPKAGESGAVQTTDSKGRLYKTLTATTGSTGRTFDGYFAMYREVTLGRDYVVDGVTYAKGTKFKSTDDTFLKMGIAKYEQHIYIGGGAQNDGEIYEALQEGMKLKVPTRVAGYTLTATVSKLAPKQVKTDPVRDKLGETGNTLFYYEDAKPVGVTSKMGQIVGRPDGGGRHVDVLLTTQDKSFSYLRTAGIATRYREHLEGDKENEPTGPIREGLTAISSSRDQSNFGVTFSLAATYNGQPVDVNTIVADADESGSIEYSQFETDGSPFERFMEVHWDNRRVDDEGKAIEDRNGTLALLDKNGNTYIDSTGNPIFINVKMDPKKMTVMENGQSVVKFYYDTADGSKVFVSDKTHNPLYDESGTHPLIQDSTGAMVTRVAEGRVQTLANGDRQILDAEGRLVFTGTGEKSDIVAYILPAGVKTYEVEATVQKRDSKGNPTEYNHRRLYDTTDGKHELITKDYYSRGIMYGSGNSAEIDSKIAWYDRKEKMQTLLLNNPIKNPVSHGNTGDMKGRGYEPSEWMTPSIYGNKQFGPITTSRDSNNKLPIALSQGVQNLSFYGHSQSSVSGFVGFIIYDGGDAPSTYGSAQHIIGNFNKTVNKQEVTATQPYLGDTPADTDFRSTAKEKSGEWVLDDLVHTEKYHEESLGAGATDPADQVQVTNQKGEKGTFLITARGNAVIRKADGSQVEVKQGDILSKLDKKTGLPVIGIYNHATRALGVGALPDEGLGQLIDPEATDEAGNKVGNDYTLRQANDTSYVLYGVKANPGVNNDKAYIRGWVDFNGNGKFDADERSELVEVTADKKTYNIVFKNIPQLLDTSIDKAGVRLRIALDKKDVSESTGVAASGEVEDFQTHVIHFPRGTEHRTKNYQGEVQKVKLPTVGMFVANGKTKESNYERWAQINNKELPPKIVLTDKMVASTEAVDLASAELPSNYRKDNGTVYVEKNDVTVYKGTLVKVKDKNNKELGTALQVVNPNNGRTEYLMTEYTEYDTVGNKVGTYRINPNSDATKNGQNTELAAGVYETTIEFTPDPRYVGTARGIAVRAWDDNNSSTGWEATKPTLDYSATSSLLADKDKIHGNSNNGVNGYKSMDTSYIPTVVDIKPVGKDEMTTDTQGKTQSASPKIPDHGTVESIIDSKIDESAVSKEHVLIDRKQPVKFALDKLIPGKTYTEDTKVTEETVLTYVDGGTETFKPADKIPAGTEIAKKAAFPITGEGNVLLSGVRIAEQGLVSSPNKVPAGAIVDGPVPTAPETIKVLRNGVEVTVNAGQQLKAGDQLVTPLPIVNGQQITRWKVRLQKGDVIPQSYSDIKPVLAEATGVDKLVDKQGSTLTYDGKDYVYNNNVIPKGTKTAGKTVSLSTVTLPKATHVDPETGEATLVNRSYSKITENEIVIENEGTYTIESVPDANGDYGDAKVTFKPHPKFVGVGTGVTLKQPDIDYHNPVDGDKVTSRYGTDYGHANYIPVVTPDLSATITRRIHYVYEGDKNTAPQDKTPILTIDGKPVTNEQTLTYNRDYIVMDKDGATDKDITIAQAMTLPSPITVDRYVRKGDQVVKEATTVTELKAGDVVKAGTQLSAGTVIIGAWKPINPENDKFTSIISPTVKGYTAEVQLPVTEYTKKETNGVQTYVRNTNSTPVGTYTPTIKDGEVNTKDVGSYDPLVSAVTADNRDDFDVYVYYKADKQVARVVYIDMDATNNDRQGVLEIHTGSTLEAKAATDAQDTSVVKKEELNGDSATRIKYSTATTIAKYEAMGYELKRDGFTNDENGDRVVGGRKFDEESVADSAKAGEKPQNQTFYVFLGHKRDTGAKTEEESVTRTINYKYKKDNTKAADSVTETLNFKREITIDMALAATEFPAETATFNAENTKATQKEKEDAQRAYNQVEAAYNAAAEKVKADATTTTALSDAEKALETAEKTLADAKKAQQDAKAAVQEAVRAAQTAYDNAVSNRDTARTNYLAANNADLAKKVVEAQKALDAENVKVAAAKAAYEAKDKDTTASATEKQAALDKFVDAKAAAKIAATKVTEAKTALETAQDEAESLKDAKEAEATKNTEIQGRALTTEEAKTAARNAYYDAIIAKVKEEAKKETPDKNKVAAVSFGEWKALASTATNLPANEQLSDAEKGTDTVPGSDNAFNHVTSPTIAGYVADKAAIDRTDAIDPLAADYSVDVFYVQGEQRATVKFVEVDPTNTDTVVTPGVAADLVEIGKSGDNFATLDTAAVKAEIKKLQDKGYTLVTDGFENPGTGVNNTTFDTDPTVDQEFVVKVKATVVEIPSFDPTKPVSNENPKPTPGVTPIDPSNPSGPKWTEDLIKAVKVQEEVTRTIKYVYEDGTEVPAEKLTDVADKKVKTLKFTRPGKINVVTGEITYGDWSANQTFEKVTSPTIENYTAAVAGVTPTTPDVPTKEVAATDKDFEEVVVYKTKVITVDPNSPNYKEPKKDQPIDPTDPNSPKWTDELLAKLKNTEKVTRTISYVYSEDANKLNQAEKDGNKGGANVVKDNAEVTPFVTEVNFNRVAKVNPVTNEITYEDWKPTTPAGATAPDDTLEGKTTVPVIPGYVATGDVEKSKTDVTAVKAEDKDITDKVVYEALGKYVPVVPAGVTPPADFDKTPKPYPNATPEDPTRPGTPTTPTTTIPEIPGTTPVGPDGTPLTKNPNGGYDLPPVPTDPTQNTTITYVKDGSQVAVVHFVDEKGNSVNESVVETGDTGKEISKSNVDSIKAKLEAKGYTVVEPTDALYTTDKEGFYKEATRTFDAVSDKSTGAAGEKVPSQQYYVIVKAKDLPVDPTKPLDPNNNPVDPTNPTPENPTKPRDPETPVTPKPEDKVPNDPKGRTYGELGLVEQVTRTINYVKNDGSKAAEPVKETLTFTRKAKINAVTGEVTYLDNDGNATTKEAAPWTPANNDSTFDKVTSPSVPDYTPTRAEVPAKENVTATDEDIVETVVYNPTKQTVDPNAPKDPSTPNVTPKPNDVVPNDPKGRTYKELGLIEEVTRTVHYVYEDGTKAAEDKVQTITFTRTAEIDTVTGAISNIGTWTLKDENNTFEPETTEAKDGYIASAAKSTEVTGVQATDKDTEETIIYRKLGSYVPVVPAGVTPPADFDKTPKPYPNATPEDPTRPGTPTTPTTTIPEIPGTTPVGPDGTPLTKNPNGGYDLPPVPTDPTQNTTITYVKDGSQVAVVHFVDEKGNSVNESVVETGDTGKEISKSNVDSIKAKLEAKGYTVVEPTDALYTTDKEGFYKEATRTFDAVSDKSTGAAGEKVPSQQYYVIVKAKDLPVDPTKPLDPNNNPVDPTNPTPENPTKPRDPETPVTPKPEDKVPNDPKGRTYGELGLVEQVTRTINYVKNDGSKAAEPVKETLTFTRKAKINAVTGEVTYLDNDGNATTKEAAPWTPVNVDKFAEKVSPSVTNYTPTVEKVAEKTGVTATDEDIVETVVYNPSTTNVDPNPVTPGENPDPNKVVENDPKKRTLKELGLIEEVTRTVHYVYEDGTKAAEDKVQTITFTRTAEIDTVTGAISNIDTWTLKDENNTFEPETTEAKDGYIASAAKSTEVTGVQATDKDTEETIIYRKLGSYVPVVPAGVTPPADFDKTPKPYPNATPEDPTRPGTPTTPTTTIPEIPGTTPVGPDGTPLTKNPNGGYDLPPVPKDPTQNTTITYVKDGSQVAVVHFIEVNSETDKTEKGAVAKSIVDTGDTGKAFTKGQSVTDTINALKAKGYTVVENGYPENGTFDADATTNQEYKVLVTVKEIPVSPDNETPTPNTPIDPQNPDGPKWTPELIKELENGLQEDVKRTIKYIYSDGTEVPADKLTDVADKKEKTLTFKRSATINPVTGKITFGNWTPDKQSFEEVTSPAIDGYIVDRATVPAKEVTETAGDITEVVVYKKLGSYVPVVPEGVTVPPGTDTTPKVYPKDPTDPTRPGTPTTVIPHIPGVTPLNPSTGKPLEPVTPGRPEDGYKVPPVPTDPTQDTNIVYAKDGSQVAIVHFVDEDGNAVHTSFAEAGDVGSKFTKAGEVAKIVTELEKSGYSVVPNKAGQAEYPGKDGEFDSVDDKGENGVSQVYYVTVAKPVPVTPTDPKNPNEDPKNPNPGDPIDPNKPDGPKWTEDALNKLNNIKTVTRTITYVKAGTDEEVSSTEAPKVTDKVNFKRTAIVNPKDGSLVGYDTNGDGKADVPATDTDSGWTAVNNDTTFDKVTSPVVKGYVLKNTAQKEVAETTGLTPKSDNETIKVEYVPVGTWTPKVPEGETPINPIPYPNDPKDPGKVVDPNDPINPNDPNKPSVPVIPHIPGTTPKDPNGNPLKPVDPTDPSKGYVPPTPTTPTENTEINYEKDTQKAVTKFVDPSGNPIPGVTNIEETGKSGEPLTKATEVTTEIAKLIAKGYDLVSNNYGKDNNGNFDKDSGKDQEYTVVLIPHVEPIKPFDPTNPDDPNTPKPGQPIDPNNPDGPKWTEELINKLETTKHVTRNITYVEDDTDKEVADKATDKVTFTREAKINVVTGTIEYGKWTPVNNDTTFDKVTSPVVPGYVLKDPSQKEVDETTGLTENSKDENIKVVYVPVGRLVPKVPDGVTPPTPTPYDNDPQDPGKVVPPSPTKPTDPQDPNSPKVPVIPYIPGTTPKVPQDPTKPVDPNTNPLVPLKPVDPKDPSKGYEVPPVPTDPGTDTPIVYENDKQKAITNFVDNNGKVVSDPVVDQGDSGSKFTKSGDVESKIKELVKKGYVVTSNDYPSADTDRVFDNDKDKDQIFNVKVTPLIVPTDPNSPDQPQVPTDPTKPVGPNNPLKPVTPSTPEPGKPVFPEDPNSPVWPETVKDMVTETTATRTITYVDRNGKEVAATHTETIKFKRTAKVNLVTGDITYGEWTVVGDDTILDGNKLPKVDGYIARGGDIESSQKDIKATAGVNITERVVYDKLGSWIPKLPEGQTQVPPTPYPNDPTDPTKPGTDRPRVPYVPGFIPVDPNGNPLKPVDPNDPTKGYEVPVVPADPTQDTPIKYIPVPKPNNGGGNNGGGGGNTPTPQPQPNLTPQPEPSPAPNPVPVTPETPEQPVVPVAPEQPAEPATPQYMDGQRELPNTGTEAHSSLAALGLLGALSGFGLIARKKRKDEE